MPEEKVSRLVGNPPVQFRCYKCGLLIAVGEVTQWSVEGYAHSLCPPAADAGPRQPATVGYDGPSRPIVSQGMRMFSVSEFIKGKWTSFADEEQVAQALANGLNAAAPPVPQEAAPRCPFGYTKEQPGTKHECAIHSLSDYEATAPDSAMRKDAALQALRQWEADTEALASAREENAFIDGFQAAANAPPVPQEAAPATGTVATFMDMDMRLDTTMPVGQVDVQDSKGRRTIIPANARPSDSGPTSNKGVERHRGR